MVLVIRTRGLHGDQGLIIPLSTKHWSLHGLKRFRCWEGWVELYWLKEESSGFLALNNIEAQERSEHTLMIVYMLIESLHATQLREGLFRCPISSLRELLLCLGSLTHQHCDVLILFPCNTCEGRSKRNHQAVARLDL